MGDILGFLSDVNTYRVNRLDAHSDHITFLDEESARKNDRTLYKNLNGMWDYKFSKNFNERPVDFYKNDFDMTEFTKIKVPSHIELQGFGDIQYTNVTYPWDGYDDVRPPNVPMKDNYVSSYVTHFDLPLNFLNREVCISFKGVEVAFSLWLNGEFVGYSEDSFTPSDFSLTKFLKEKDNRLCVEVYRRSTSSYIEDQDFFRFSGIFRDVILYAKTENHIEDLFLKPVVLDNLKDATLEISVKTEKTPKIKARLLDSASNEVFESILDFKEYKEEKTYFAENEISYYVSQKFDIKEVKLWGELSPNLYTLELIGLDENDNVLQVIHQKIGFRHFVLKDKVMYLNGKRLIINGVNRHEWSATNGRSITKEDMLKDIEILKKNNITAVRTSHYPNQSMWYELCDENGILVMDETNLESHGAWITTDAYENWNVPGSLKLWENVVMDRAVSMFERDKNHPSILWWSCGNESNAGTCILNMANYFRKKDDSRVVHYEGCWQKEEFSDCTDIQSRMYAYPHEIDEYFEKDGSKPFVLCEYMHNMGNSLGGMESYIKRLDKYEGYQGGFIWDYMDQALLTKKDGVEFLGYGGDFADRPTEYNFSGNGIVTALREEKPCMSDVRYFYSTKEQREEFDKINALEIKKSNESLKNDKIVGNGTFEIVEGDKIIGIIGENFNYKFANDQNGPVSFVSNGVEWLDRPIKPVFWRAPTENDTKNHFLKTSGIYKALDLYAVQCDMSIEKSDDFIKISYIYDSLNMLKSEISYKVFGDGTILLEALILDNKDLPEMPCFGIEFQTFDKIYEYEYIGYSGETYPDKYKGSKFSYHKENVKHSNYLVPQESRLHYKSHFARIKNEKSELLITKVEDDFHFSILPNTSHEIENASHNYELPNNLKSSIRILSEMRGVGGIDSWGADVEEKYRVKEPKKLEVYFKFKKL